MNTVSEKVAQEDKEPLLFIVRSYTFFESFWGIFDVLFDIWRKVWYKIDVAGGRQQQQQEIEQ